MKTSFYTEEELKEIGFKSVGKNVLISRKASIYGAENIEIGDNVRIDDFGILSGRIKLGSFIHIAAGTFLFGGDAGIVMEDFSGLSSRVAVYTLNEDYGGEFLTNPTVPSKYRKVTHAPVLIKRHAIIGTGTTILPGVTIGEGASVGAMSLVTKDIPDWVIAVGIPAKPIKERKRNLLELEKELLRELNRGE
ncbi:acyltransferase [Thermotoga profunda]|uniref:acyltransferase n=1 Tax=Thermotoga profunda TaxID=1508420 RepID=UPI000596BC65|nr:acyltransferase [Thermotoga profunda]